MAYSEEQLNKFAFITQVVVYEIESRIDQLHSNLRINYTMRSKEEKNDFTISKLEEIRSELGKLDGLLAEYIGAALDKDQLGYDNNTFNKIISNFVGGNVFEEDLEGVEINEDYEYDGFEFNLSHSDMDYSFMLKFIECMALAQMHETLVEFRENEKKELPDPKIYNILKENKSLLFNGKSLNLTERIKIAKGVLDFEGQIKKLNISDPEKYQLMAYILGNDKDNVRNRITGTRTDKVRENEILKYIEYLKQ